MFWFGYGLMVISLIVLIIANVKEYKRLERLRVGMNETLKMLNERRD